MERIENLVRLIFADGLGPSGLRRLLRHLGDADRVLGASEAELLAVPGIGPKQARAAARAASFDPAPELDRVARAGVLLLAYDSPAYPKALLALHNPPALLYCRGAFQPGDEAGFAIVGTRAPTPYGAQQAKRFGSLLARAGFTVVSGLARGVDAHAHQGALDAGCRTLAVMGCGLAQVYPAEHCDLAAEIARSGVVISEFPMEQAPARDTFPRRNRIIAALAWGVLVVEAPTRSGALITARHAVELGREVFALPGRVDTANSAGCHRLIRDGATLVADLDDILGELPADAPRRAAPAPVEPPAPRGHPETAPPAAAPPPASAIMDKPGGFADAEIGESRQPGVAPPPAAPASASPARAPLRPRPPPAAMSRAVPAPAPAHGDDAARVLDALSDEPATIDDLVTAARLPVDRVSSALLMLELARAVEARPGKIYVRKR